MVDIGTIIDLIPSFIKSRLCSKEERKQRHLDDIKKDVLQPLFNNLTTIYIPILEKEKEIVIDGYSYNKEQIQFKLVSTLESVKIESIGLIVKPNYQKINENLYSDMKEKHFRELVKEWEDFESQIKHYSGNWVSYADKIFTKINDELRLPIISTFDMTGDFIYTYRIAAYVTNIIYGFNQRNPIRYSEKGLSFVNMDVLRGSKEKQQKCLDLIDKLEKDDSFLKELNPAHKELLGKAYHLQRELDRTIKTYKLSGNCEFV